SPSTPIVTLMNQGDTQQLVQQLERVEALSPEQRALLPTLLDVLVRQHQQQLTASSLQKWLCQVQWRPKPQQGSRAGLLARAPGYWVIFADQGGVGTALATLLEERNQRCLLVYAGAALQSTAPGIWYLNPTNPDDFARLFQEALPTEPLPCRGVVHL